jgi:hypothetical protein
MENIVSKGIEPSSQFVISGMYGEVIILSGSARPDIFALLEADLLSAPLLFRLLGGMGPAKSQTDRSNATF